MNWDVLNSKLRAVLMDLQSQLPAPEVDDIADYIDHNEQGVAFEMLCSQLYEHNAGISAHAVEQLAEIGSAMNLRPRQWQILRVVNQ